MASRAKSGQWSPCVGAQLRPMKQPRSPPKSTQVMKDLQKASPPEPTWQGCCEDTAKGRRPRGFAGILRGSPNRRRRCSSPGDLLRLTAQKPPHCAADPGTHALCVGGAVGPAIARGAADLLGCEAAGIARAQVGRQDDDVATFVSRRTRLALAAIHAAEEVRLLRVDQTEVRTLLAAQGTLAAGHLPGAVLTENVRAGIRRADRAAVAGRHAVVAVRAKAAIEVTRADAAGTHFARAPIRRRTGALVAVRADARLIDRAVALRVAARNAFLRAVADVAHGALRIARAHLRETAAGL